MLMEIDKLAISLNMEPWGKFNIRDNFKCNTLHTTAVFKNLSDFVLFKSMEPQVFPFDFNNILPDTTVPHIVGSLL